jgi:arsenate reductase
LSAVRVLFLCTGNSARSILAEALLHHFGGNAFEVHSAGTDPRGINPYTLQVLAELRVATEGIRTKSVVEYEGHDFDYVITVCDQAAEHCPVFPNAPSRLHWSFPDPAAVPGNAAEKLAAFRKTASGLEQRIRTFIATTQR